MSKSNTITNIEYLKPIPEEHLVGVEITSEESESTELETFEVTITFNEPVTGFVVGDITKTNCTLSNFAGSGKVYTVDVSPTIAGEVTLNIAAGVAATRVGYLNSIATEFSIDFVVN